MVPLENLSVRKSVKQSKKFCFEIYNPELEKNKDKPKIKSCKKTKEGERLMAPEIVVATIPFSDTRATHHVGEGFRQGHHKEYMICASSQVEVRPSTCSRYAQIHG
jgi:hypothetical protein